MKTQQGPYKIARKYHIRDLTNIVSAQQKFIESLQYEIKCLRQDPITNKEMIHEH